MTRSQAGRLGGLMNTGEANPHAKLTHARVARIRFLMSNGCGREDVAWMFGVSPQQISRLVLRRGNGGWSALGKEGEA